MPRQRATQRAESAISCAAAVYGCGAFGHCGGQPVQLCVIPQQCLRQRQDLRSCPGNAPLRGVRTVMGIDRFDKFGQPLALGGNEFEHRNTGLGPQVACGLVGALTVGLVDHHQIGDLQQPRLGGLDGVARTGVEDHHGRVGDCGDLDLGLPDAHRLQHDQVVGQCGQQPDGRGDCGGESAQVAAGGDRADQHVGVVDVGGHPDPVSQ